MATSSTPATNLTPPPAAALGPNASVTHLGPFSGLSRYLLQVPALGKVSGKVFLKPVLGLTGMEVSATSLPPGFAMPFLHRHVSHEELHIVISGEGEQVVDGHTVKLSAGSCVRMAPDGARAIRNTSSTEPLVYLCIQAQANSMTDAETTADGRLAPGAPWPSP